MDIYLHSRDWDVCRIPWKNLSEKNPLIQSIRNKGPDKYFGQEHVLKALWAESGYEYQIFQKTGHVRTVYVHPNLSFYEWLDEMGGEKFLEDKFVYTPNPTSFTNVILPPKKSMKFYFEPHKLFLIHHYDRVEPYVVHH